MRVRQRTRRHTGETMTAAHALILGIVQGLTEFIPVSSKTHLVVVPALLHFKPPPLKYIVLLHAGTLLALVVYFIKDLLGFAADLPRKGSEGRRIVGLLIVATIPAAIVGKLFEKTFDDLLTKHPRTDAFLLLLTAVILLTAEWLTGGIGKRLARPLRERVVLRDAVVMGCAQAFALFPGISRSGSTMASGLGGGLRRDVAARFSFLMSIPIIFGADLLDLPGQLKHGVNSVQLIGFASSFVFGFAAVWFLLRYLRDHSFLPFAIWCAGFGIVAGVLLGH
jgi:undecaprenyl-diphosphatase